MSTLSVKLSAEARDLAMLPLFPHSDCELAQLVILTLAREQAEVTSDDLWRELEARGVDSLYKPNAIGAAFHAVARKGAIESTGRVVKSARVSAHRRNVIVWKSLIFEGVAA